MIGVVFTRPSANIPWRYWALSMHVCDSDSWFWCRIFGVEINVPRRA